MVIFTLILNAYTLMLTEMQQSCIKELSSIFIKPARQTGALEETPRF